MGLCTYTFSLDSRNTMQFPTDASLFESRLPYSYYRSLFYTTYICMRRRVCLGSSSGCIAVCLETRKDHSGLWNEDAINLPHFISRGNSTFIHLLHTRVIKITFTYQPRGIDPSKCRRSWTVLSTFESGVQANEQRESIRTKFSYPWLPTRISFRRLHFRFRINFLSIQCIKFYSKIT